MKHIVLNIIMALWNQDVPPKLLHSNIPVVVYATTGIYKTKLESMLTDKLGERKYSVVSSQKANDMVLDNFDKLAKANADQFKSSKDILDYTKKIVNSMPVVYQNLAVKLVLGHNDSIDSCYYSLTYMPALKPSPVIALPDSIVRKNGNISLITTAIIDYLTTNPVQRP